MEIIQTKTLSKEQKTEILALMKKLKNAQGLTLSFPFEDASSFYLLYQSTQLSKELVSVLSLVLPEESDSDFPAECAAFTAPDHQKRRYFSTLFQAAEEEFDDYDLLFYIDNTNEGALKALESIEAEWDFNECRMDYSLSSTPIPKLSKVPTLVFKAETSAETGDLLMTVFDGTGQETKIGTAHASLSGHHACLYSFEILEEYRHLGYGSEAMLLFLDFLQNTGAETVFLHVSGENEVALHLYEKTGFRITETLSCYLY